MKIHPIQLAFDKLNSSIKNMGREYPEGRNVLIRCLAGNANRTELEVFKWLKENEIEIFKLEDYDPNRSNQ